MDSHRQKFYRVLLVALLATLLAAEKAWSFPEQKEKIKIHRIIIQGNHVFSAGTIKEVMLTKEYHWLSHHYYDEGLLKDDLNAITRFYHNQGFLEAEVKDYRVDFNPAKQEVDIAISVAEGSRTTVEGVSLFGNQVLSEEELRARIHLKAGDPFLREKLEQDNYNLLALYADRGYIDAKVEPQLKWNQPAHRVLVDYLIDEGSLIRIGEIFLRGLEKTKPKVVKRELTFKTGEVFNYSKILESQRRLYLTGLFKSVFIRPVQGDSSELGHRDVVVEVAEKQNGEINLGMGYGTVDKVRGSFEVLQNNFQGTARQVGLLAHVSFIQRRAEFSLTDPWFLATHTRADLNGYVEQKEEPSFDLFEKGGRFTLGKPLTDLSKITLSYKYEDVTLSNISGAVAVKDQKGNTRSLTFAAIWDDRDDLFNARQGFYLATEVETAGSFLKGSNTFLKGTWHVKGFFPVGRQSVLGSALEVGWMDNFGPSKEIPLNERFFAGGPTSQRGFREKYLGPLNPLGQPIGGKILVVANLAELRFPVYQKLGGIVFLDAGNVWAEPREVGISDVRTAAGLGVRYHSPLGILRLDYGIKLDRRRGESPWALHFSLGQAF